MIAQFFVSLFLTLLAVFSFFLLGVIVDFYIINGREKIKLNWPKLLGLGVGAVSIFQLLFGIVGIVVAVDPAHDLASLGIGHRLPFVHERLFGSLGCVRARAEHVDDEVLVDDRRRLPAPAWRAGEGSFPEELAGVRVQAP